MTAEAPSWLTLQRRVRFSDTDAAGVVHFQQLLGWCHQAWEESLELYGIAAGTIFPGGRQPLPNIALPIVHCEADFRAPLHTGDVVFIRLEPKRLDPGCFEVSSHFRLGEKHIARGCIRHVAIDAITRSRCQLPAELDYWLEASALGQVNSL